MGERLHHQIDLNCYKAASTLLLFCPETPLLFMGQEFAASSPFLFFTDHNSDLGKLITEGRRKEFQKFSAFSDPKIREKIPDPQAQTTFVNSHLKWTETTNLPHSAIFKMYKELLKLRNEHECMQHSNKLLFDAVAFSERTIILIRKAPIALSTLVAVIHMNGQDEELELDLGEDNDNDKSILFSTWDENFQTSKQERAPEIYLEEEIPKIRFRDAGALILQFRKKPQ